MLYISKLLVTLASSEQYSQKEKVCSQLGIIKSNYGSQTILQENSIVSKENSTCTHESNKLHEAEETQLKGALVTELPGSKIPTYQKNTIDKPQLPSIKSESSIKESINSFIPQYSQKSNKILPSLTSEKPQKENQPLLKYYTTNKKQSIINQTQNSASSKKSQSSFSFQQIKSKKSIKPFIFKTQPIKTKPFILNTKPIKPQTKQLNNTTKTNKSQKDKSGTSSSAPLFLGATVTGFTLFGAKKLLSQKGKKGINPTINTRKKKSRNITTSKRNVGMSTTNQYEGVTFPKPKKKKKQIKKTI